MILDLSNLTNRGKLEKVFRCKTCGKIFEQAHQGVCTCVKHYEDKDIHTKIINAIASLNNIRNQMPLYEGRINRIAFFQHRLDMLNRFYYAHIVELKFIAKKIKIETKTAREDIESLVNEYRKFENSTDRKLKREMLFLKRHISSIVMKDFEHSDVFDLSISINLEKK